MTFYTVLLLSALAIAGKVAIIALHFNKLHSITLPVRICFAAIFFANVVEIAGFYFRTMPLVNERILEAYHACVLMAAYYAMRAAIEFQGNTKKHFFRSDHLLLLFPLALIFSGDVAIAGVKLTDFSSVAIKGPVYFLVALPIAGYFFMACLISLKTCFNNEIAPETLTQARAFLNSIIGLTIVASTIVVANYAIQT